jgi:hypothetical protein
MQLSHSSSEYLHHNRLPYVDALVLSNQTGEPSSVVLSGSVRTERGQRDAESKARDYLDAPDLSIRNRTALDSTLAVNRVGGSPSTTQTLSESPERTIAASSYVEQCDQIYSSCSSACQTQNAGSRSPKLAALRLRCWADTPAGRLLSLRPSTKATIKSPQIAARRAGIPAPSCAI